MSNPFFDRSPAFNGKGGVGTTPNGYPAMPGYQPGAQYGQAPTQGYPGYSQATTQTYPGYGQAPAQGYPGYGQVSPNQVAGLEAQYAAPSATNVDRGRMTYDDVIVRTAGMFALILGTGALSWMLATNRATMGVGYLVMILGSIGALVLGLVNSFKKEPSPALIMAYAACEGAMLGAFSGVMNYLYPGIVIQAMGATAATFVVMLCAYKFANFRVSARVARILLIAMGGYLLFSLVNLVLMATGAVTDPWGLRGSVTIMGIPLGVIVGLVVVVMAAVSLAMDFEAIQRGVEGGLPTRYAWAGAFGLVVTIVWLYVEFLRILAILRDN
ncbi:Bax inhibitor-1/YccA family protein [uncultured Actinomyces sp.]|uniref:Bax inhibitor-1/YccA family protein n=1 Tax=uncultured Actinomyces sp. TaxID=249061 RepID=UPI0026173027|nr:Bax inhibitor-1/YccA family protein [uncultured Actinomyces sp.]